MVELNTLVVMIDSIGCIYIGGVEKLGSPEETYDDFSASLPANECRYAVFDFDFTTNENCQKSKIFFIAW